MPFGTYVNNRNELYEATFSNLRNTIPVLNWLSQRPILVPKNDSVPFLNGMLTRTSGEDQIFTSIDTIMDEEEAVNYPVELLNSPSCFMHRIVKLKVGVPVMLLRNLNASKLCDGTRLIIKQMLPTILEAAIITGTA